MAVCASGKGKDTPSQQIDLTAIYCRYLCPAPPGEFIKEDFLRFWSDTSNWPENRLPAAGENVTIEGPWTMIMDVDPAPIEYLLIEGDLAIPSNRATANLIVDSMWIRSGSLKAGNSSTPFTGDLTIQINGNKNDPGYVFTPEVVGNKQVLVTGDLHLYGVAPSTTWTRLKSFANQGDTSITVDSVSGWNVGDQIVLGPSFNSASEHELVTIQSISSKTVTFTPALQYNHYGDSSVTINNTFGILDTRTAVGHITRNIKFVAGPDNGWGYTILGYGYSQNDILRTGNIILSGV